MDAPALEVTIVAAQPGDIEDRLAQALRREGIAVSEDLGEAWGHRTGSASTVYVWFLATPLPEQSYDRVTAWLDQQSDRPAMIAISNQAQVESLLAAGLDDAVQRSISDRELVARVRALHRRMMRRPREGQLRFGALTVDTVERSAWMDGTVVSITPIEQAVLVALIRAGGRALTRVALLEAAWGDSDFEISERAVDNVILRLRRKLPRPDVIETVRAVGFRLARPQESRHTPDLRDGDPRDEEDLHP